MAGTVIDHSQRRGSQGSYWEDTIKLIIEIELEANDLEEADFENFVREAKKAEALNMEVGRSLNEKHSHIVRMFQLSAENFTARLEQ
jgi:hypothetical protein